MTPNIFPDRRQYEKLPLLAFTSGDGAGIGPESVIRALHSPRLRAVCRPVLIGERQVWLRAGWRPSLAPCLDTGLGLKAPPYGKTGPSAARASFAALRLAWRLAARGLVDAIVTAPVSKKSWHEAGIGYRDHTEYFSAQTGRRSEMVLCAPGKKLWCLLATRHIPLNRVSSSLNAAAVADAANCLSAALRRLGGPFRPRLGLCGLNPHAGEEGLLGGEERRILLPALKRARSAGIRLEGPIAADTAWRRHVEGKLDGLICLYHDQALIPLKTAAGLGVVNWTVGLPFVRTSPGHGTGFDIAGKGLADPAATIAAAELAASLC
ncbi:MAG: hypothetical protein A3J74_10835 [Elusimicrobia bacterium RIFCSPHIGHO2_02_FULL_57_9]|nr:MAG: hypothetical protein A3J74_10835 [Elusimicrobia bacterium RIFCSPHIGHO2_02_FULL_57_9]